MHRFSLILRWSLMAMKALRVGFGAKNIKILMNIHDMQMCHRREEITSRAEA